MTAGNEQAAEFLISVVGYCHLMDDIWDKDKEVTDAQLVTASLKIMECLMLNPWVKDRHGLLWPLLVVSFNAWLDANRWERGENAVLRQDADVVKGVYHEVLFFVAFLCGGWEHMKSMSTKYREYDHEKGSLWQSVAEAVMPQKTSVN